MENFGFTFVGDVRCIGMVGAIELVKDKKTKELLISKSGLARDF